VTDELRHHVDEAVAEAETEANARYALGVAVACATKVGFEVLESSVSTGVRYVRQSAWASHAVRVAVDSSTSEVTFDLVHTPGSDAVTADEDIQVGKEFCDDFPKILKEAKEQGVDLSTPSRNIPPGRIRTRKGRSWHSDDRTPLRAKQRPL
jgi:hypothetical protein